MSKVKSKVREISQKSGLEAIVLSVMANSANVRLSSTSGRLLHGVRIVGGPPNVGDRVTVSFQDGIPYIAVQGGGGAGGSTKSDFVSIEPTTPIVSIGGGDTPPGALDPLSAAGWIIDQTTGDIYKDNIHISPAGRFIAGSGNDVAIMNGSATDQTTYRFWAGHTQATTASFSVMQTGYLTASAGVMGGWSLSANSVYKNSIALNAANTYITAGSKTTFADSNTGFWVGLDGTLYKMHVGNQTQYMRWNASSVEVAGALSATTISATTGYIGGFTLSTSSIYATGITLESGSNPAVEIGNATDYLTGDGVWMGKYSGNYAMHIGNPAGNFLDYNAATGKMHVQSIVTVTQEVIATIGGRILVAPSTILTAALSNTQSNLISNMSFETSGGGGADVFANWTENAGTGGITKDATIYYDGLASCKLTSGSGLDTYVYQAFSVTALTPYSIVFWTRGDGTKDGRYGVYDVTHSTWLVSITSTGVTAATWTRFLTTVTPTSGTTSLRIYFYCPDTYINYAHFDFVMISQDTMQVKHNEMVSGDYAYLSSGVTKEWVKVLSTPASGEPYNYYIQRDQAGAGLVSFVKGDPVVNTGQANDGYIDIYATNSIRGATIYGPTLQGIVRPNPCTLYSQMNEHWAIGNLNGIYGYSATTYGIGLGRYKLSAYDTFITIDATNGFRIRHKLDSDVTYTIGQWDMSGSFVLGSTTWGTNKANVKWNSSNQRLEFRGGSDGTTVASYIDTDGSFNINVGTVLTKPVLINWMENTSRIAYIGAYKSTVPNQCNLAFYVESISTYDNIITMNAPTNTTGKFSKILFVAQSYDYSSNQAYIDMYGGKTGAGYEPYIDINAGSPYGSILMEALVTKVTGDVRLSNGLHVGSPTNAVDPDSYSISVSGDYQSYKNSTKYTGYIYVPLTTPLSSTSWDGDTYYTTSNTLIDLSSVFSAPAGMKAIYAGVTIKDLGATASNDAYLAFANSSGGTQYVAIRGGGDANGQKFVSNGLIINCNADGDIYYKVVATASGIAVYLQIWGYWI